MHVDQRGFSPLVLLTVILAVAVVGFGFITFWQSSVATGEAESLRQALQLAEQQNKELEQELSDAQARLAEKEKAATEAEKKAADEKAAMEAALKAPDDWLTVELKTLGLSFRYPKEWDATKVIDAPGETGSAGRISFAKYPKLEIVAGYRTPDWSVGGEASEEPFAPDTAVDCDGLKNFVRNQSKIFEKIESCEMLTKGGRTILMVHFPDLPDEPFYIGERNSGFYYTGNARYPYLYLIAGDETGVTLETMKKILWSVK